MLQVRQFKLRMLAIWSQCWQIFSKWACLWESLLFRGTQIVNLSEELCLVRREGYSCGCRAVRC
eukprot:13149347-Alexandrium_andersonii.AAC.1